MVVYEKVQCDRGGLGDLHLLGDLLERVWDRTKNLTLERQTRRSTVALAAFGATGQPLGSQVMANAPNIPIRKCQGELRKT